MEGRIIIKTAGRAKKAVKPYIPNKPTEEPSIRIAHDFSFNIRGHLIPKNAVYAVFPSIIRNGRTLPKVVVWVDKIHMAKTQQHFTAHVVRGDNKPTEEYLDGTRGFARKIKNFIMANCTTENVVQVMPNKVIDKDGPHMRKIGQYIQRPIPGKDDNPYMNDKRINESSVVTGIYKYRNTEEGYNCLRMGVRPDDYGNGKKTIFEFDGLDLEKDFVI